MFTGIIQDRQKIISIHDSAQCRQVVVRRTSRMRVRLGDSVALNGICSTICQVKRAAYAVEYMPETIALTTAGQWQIGQYVNVEPSLRMGDSLGGHFVMGHVDGVGRVIQIDRAGRSRVVRIAVPKSMMPYIVRKGSITIDGVSITVVRITTQTLTVSLVDFTLRHTTLGTLRRGQAVNIELDTIARYVQSLMHTT